MASSIRKKATVNASLIIKLQWKKQSNKHDNGAKTKNQAYAYSNGSMTANRNQNYTSYQDYRTLGNYYRWYTKK